MDKSPDAFRTISEVAEALETPAHVLRFWESRFPQIKPVKRAGGRRYYRPVDVALLAGIRHLLHDEGMTIRGVQKILREQGVRHVAALVPHGDMSDFDAMEDDDLALDLSVSGEVPVTLPEPGQVLPMDLGVRRISTLPDAPGEIFHLHAPVGPQSEREPADIKPSDLERSDLEPFDLEPSDLAEAQTGDAELQAELADLERLDRASSDALQLDLIGGFPLPTANRRPLPTLEPAASNDQPEADHVWVEDDEQADIVAPLFAIEAGTRDLHDPDFADAALAEVEEPVYDPEAPDFATDAGMVEPLFAVQAGVRDLDHLANAGDAAEAEPDADVDLHDPGTEVDLVPQAVQRDLAGPPAAAHGLNLMSELSHVGMAARLRALRRPVSANALDQFSELQMRLGLLQAQMIEAARVRR